MSTVRKDALHVQSDLAEREILVVKPSTARHMKRNQIRPTSEEEGEILSRQRRLHRYQSFADTIMKTDQMFAIFVVKFDTHGGNMIEWQSPADIDLSGIEFKAMPSGLHRVEKDFVYFKRGTLFGLAAFHRRMLDGANQERGARMKSVGVLMQNFTNLYVHQSFLEQEVMKQTQHNQVPDYEQLLSYFDTHRQPVISNSELTHLESQYARNANIIFSGTTSRSICFHGPDTAHFYPNPLFYVNVSDLDGLTHESAYIGATTESIFEMKRGIYDIYLKNQTVVYSNEAVENVCKPTSGDSERLRQLQSIFAFIAPPGRISVAPNKVDEDRLKQFFVSMNTTILNVLKAFSKTGEVVTPQLLRNFSLHRSDMPFLRALCAFHGFDVVFHASCVNCTFC